MSMAGERSWDDQVVQVSFPLTERESEAWTIVADTLEMLQDMPPATTGNLFGLCMVTFALRYDNIVDWRLASRMRQRLEDLPASAWQKRDDGYLFAPGRWRPRAKLARKLAAQCQRQGL